MLPLSNPSTEQIAARALADQINAALAAVPDKDWNYSRLRLLALPLTQIRGPFALGCDWVHPRSRAGRQQLKSLEAEMEWGARHSDDLSFLEIASLRINRALSQYAGPKSKFWGESYPILRVVRREQLRAMGSTMGLWYEIEEVEGSEFERR